LVLLFFFFFFFFFDPSVACVDIGTGVAIVLLLADVLFRGKFIAIFAGGDGLHCTVRLEVFVPDILRGNLEAVEKGVGLTRVELFGAERIEHLGERELN